MAARNKLPVACLEEDWALFFHFIITLLLPRLAFMAVLSLEHASVPVRAWTYNDSSDSQDARVYHSINYNIADKAKIFRD